MSDDDSESLLELIQLYLSKTLEQMKELEKAIHQKNASTTARIAHSMVGANAMVGMNNLVPLLRTLEAHGEKNEIPQAKLTFETIRQEFERIQTGLKDHVRILDF